MFLKLNQSTVFDMMYNVSVDPSEITTQAKFNYDRTKQADWIVSVIVDVILISLTFWMLTSLIHYGYKTKKWRKTSSHEHVLNSGLIYICVIACAISCILRYTFSLTLLNIGYETNQSRICIVISHSAFFFHISAYFFVTLFLWLRQRVFFINQLLNIHYNSVIKFFSLACIIIFSSYGFFVIVYTFCVEQLASGIQGCKPTVEHIATVYLASGIAWSVVSQAVLVGLLVYALTQVKAFQTNMTQKLKISKNVSVTEKRTSKIQYILQRTVTIAVISIVFNILLQIISFLMLKQYFRFSVMIYDIVLFLNLLLLIFSFSSYKDIFTSLFQAEKLINR